MSSWEEIVKRNAANVVNAALRVLGNDADAEDISQEVFAEAFQKWKASEDHQWAGLLRKMAVFRALDFLRSRTFTETLDNVSSCSTKEEPSEIASAKELENQLRIALRRLAPREGEVFCLHFFERLSQEEIANELGIPRGAVATSLCKARSRLMSDLSLYLSKESK